MYIFLSVMTFNISNSQQLESHLWTNRVIIVKTSDSDDNTFLKQLKAFKKDQAGMIERKLVLYTVIKDDIKFTEFKSNQQKQLRYNSLDKSAQKLFDTTSAFEVVLIGLDGNIKLKQYEFLSLKELYTGIDGMPMRQTELNGKN